MKLTYTPAQLRADLLAGVLNQAFIKSEVKQRQGPGDFVRFSLDNTVCQLSVLGNTLQLNHLIQLDHDIDIKTVKLIVEHINDCIIHATYVGLSKQGFHLVAFHHSHWIPEDETISAGYIVKLARSFVLFQKKHLGCWKETVQIALMADNI